MAIFIPPLTIVLTIYPLTPKPIHENSSTNIKIKTGLPGLKSGTIPNTFLVYTRKPKCLPETFTP